MKKLNKIIITLSVIIILNVIIGIAVRAPVVSATSNIIYIVTANSLNVMAGAGTNYKVIGSLKKGQQLSVISKSKGWYKINYNKKVGFVSAKYVKESMPSNDNEFVNVKKIDSSFIVDLRYNTKNNFTKKRIYNFSQAVLRRNTANKLVRANEIIKKQGFVIKIWDAYRPLSAQQALWNVYPNSTYVARPNPKNIRGHQLGATVDITLCYLSNGREVAMQSGFDDFSKKASRNYKRTAEQEKAYRIMNQAMIEVGFEGYVDEWWHYSDTNQNFKPVQVNPAKY